MGDLEFKLNSEGVRQLMKSPEMMKVCTDYANAALSRLGDGYAMDTRVGASRVNAEVKAVTYEARKENSQTNSILKALR